MELKVSWTDLATKQLDTIFDFYKTTATVSVARKIVKGIVARTNSLPKQPQKGPQELLLSNRPKEYRYLIEGNFKIIYWIEPSEIFIAAVFDTRQNPEKMNQIN